MSQQSAAEDRRLTAAAARIAPVVASKARAAGPTVVPVDIAAGGAQQVAAAAVAEAGAAGTETASAVAAAAAEGVSTAPGGEASASMPQATRPAQTLPSAGAALRATASGAADAPAARIFRDDPRLDRRIIEGMLRDRDTFIAKMGREGYTEGAVLRRAAELGLSEALIRQVKSVAADLAGERPGRRGAPASLGARTCLSCDRIFLSSGPGNRLCMRCRGGDAGLAQL